jgi:CubicO group peptidase (beta-lactamase class C family)
LWSAGQFYAASTAKGVASSVAHVLAERGELSYDLRAADVWPEFGSHGKDRVTGVAVGVMRNRFTVGDLSTVTLIDRIVAETLS